MTTETPLLELIFDRLATDQTDTRTTDLVLASLGHDGDLDATLGGATPELAIDTAAPPQPDPLYLSSVTVSGFRGIGPARSLPIRPGPGLTLVVGRNGSGKSSFAEAIELLLTGDSARWADKSSVWRTGWRNLHHPDPCTIEADLRTDGTATPLRFRRTWAPDAALTDATVSGADLAELRRPMELYRPFLTAAELGRLVTGTPSALFDAIDAILGLDALTTADQRLFAAIKPLEAATKQHRADRTRLRGALAEIDDDRARRAAAALAGATADLQAILDEPLSGDLIDQHRRWATLSLPDLGEVAALAEDLREASLQARATTDATATVRLAELLRLALDHHTTAGASPCPVCHVGTLDDAWRTTAATTLDELRVTALGAQRAATRRAELIRRARAVTANLSLPSPIDSGPLTSAVIAAADTLLAAPSAGEELAVHLLTCYPTLVAAVDEARSAAAAWLERRDTGWQQILPDLRRWVDAACDIPRQSKALAELKAARAWLKDAAVVLRNQRLAPFAAHAQQIWEELRQESNVRLGTMSLAGTATRRRIEFPISVDDADNGTALGVMSQGEMHALGLAMFLPRACAAESPFRFVVIDDPVQSMDPSKVDGLARVLAGIATDRQVVVFTHDPRLSDAVRRLEIDAVTLQVVRAEQSVVSIKPTTDPALRYLDDAWALARSAEVDADVRTPVVAELCRSALEYACQRVVWQVRTARGDRHADIEEALQHAHKTTTLFALALFDDADRGGDVLSRLRNAYGGWAVHAYDISRKAVHGGHHVADLPGFVSDTRRLAEALR